MMTVMALAFLLPAEGDAGKLKVGDQAPAFSLQGQQPATVSYR